MQYLYRYDKYGRLTEKTDRIPEGVVIRMNDERTHRYEYDNQHRLVHYVRTQHGETQAEGRYVYDPLGRRVGKGCGGGSWFTGATRGWSCRAGRM